MNNILYARKKANLTQEEAANLLGISRRSYQEYESDIHKISSYKYEYFVKELEKQSQIDEEHGIRSIDSIKHIVKEVLDQYDVTSCYLFGSYAKGKAKSDSDIDLLIDTTVTGIQFYGLVEHLREALSKRIDLLDINQVVNNKVLLQEILKDGIKLY